MTSRQTMTDRARLAWGKDIPEWVDLLALACDERTQREVARITSYSTATLSYVISKSYRGDLSKVEAAVRAALMATEVSCPVLGVIGSGVCHAHQRVQFSTANPQAARLFRACRGGCSHSRLTEQNHGR